MIAPPLKRFSSSVVSGVRKIAVEGNIGMLISERDCFGVTSYIASAATGKTTFLRLLQESNSSYHVVSEPLTKWQNVEDPQVRHAWQTDIVLQCVGFAAGVRLPAVWQ